MAILKSFLFLALAFLTFNTQANAKRNKGELFLSDLVSPFQTPARYIVYGGAIATTIAYFNQKNQTERTRSSFKDARPLGDTGIVGDIIGLGFLNIGYIAIASWYGFAYEDEKAKRNAELMARASVMASGSTVLFKAFIHEKRPGFPEDENSFPSGHSSGAFSFASVVAARHGWGYGSAAYALAGFIAVSRVNDNFHYLHDILAGITIGASFGWGVHYNMQKGGDTWFTLMPTPNRGLGLAAGWSF